MRNKIIDLVDSKYTRKDYPEFAAGDTVRVHWKIREGDKERVQAFEGLCIRKKNGPNGTFTVRKVSYGVGTERIFPLNSPRYEKIEVISRGRVRRARLFYIRNLHGKAARIQTERDYEAAAQRKA